MNLLVLATARLGVIENVPIVAYPEHMLRCFLPGHLLQHPSTHVLIARTALFCWRETKESTDHLAVPPIIDTNNASLDNAAVL